MGSGFGSTVTVLFADVEGSAALAQRLGAARWRAMLSDYEALLQERLARFGGSQLTGLDDAHLLAFPSARAAVSCAVDIQQVLPPELRVRMGLHSGEPGGGDGYGLTGVKASRIAGLARGGEVLASRLVAELAEGEDEGFRFEDERDVELRGLRGRHSVAVVRWQMRDERPLTAVVADDSAVVRDGVAAVLRESGVEVKATAADADALYAAVDRHRPDVAVVDIRMPPTRTNEGLVAAARLANSHPEVGVLVLSQFLEPAYALELVRERAPRRGYLLKDRISNIETLLDAIRRVARGGCVIDEMITERLVDQAGASARLDALTEREREVLSLIAQGLSNRAIAERLVVTLKTVETHIGQIFLKLDLREETVEHRRVAAVLTYLRATSEG